MRVLFLGGTGLISSACTELGVRRGIDVFHLNRGNRTEPASIAGAFHCDVRDEAAVREALGQATFDVVVDWIGFHPEEVESRIRLFRDRTAHYIFVSSATVYRKPPRAWPIDEDSPRSNPFWQYARDKIACEDRLFRAFHDEGFPVTVVRPSHTYGESSIPLAVRSLTRPFTTIARLRARKPLIVPGDGASLWTLTHTDDFAQGLVGLLGRADTIGHAFNIMSDEALSWNEIYRLTAEAAGTDLVTVHMTSEFLADCLPDVSGRLIGDSSATAVFDTTKLKRFVPEFAPRVRFAEGIRRAVAWYDADPARREVDVELDGRWDRLIEAHERGLAVARQTFGTAR